MSLLCHILIKKINVGLKKLKSYHQSSLFNQKHALIDLSGLSYYAAEQTSIGMEVLNDIAYFVGGWWRGPLLQQQASFQ